MTIALDSRQLAAIHSALKSIPDRANKAPVAGMFHFAPADGRLVVTATDMDLETAVTLDVAADFAPVCLPPYLVETGGKLAAEKVMVELDDRQAVVKAGRSRFTAPVLPGEDFPRLTPAFDGRIEIAGEGLAKLVEATIDAVSVPGEDHRFYLEGVFLQLHEARLTATATDGHRLHTASIAAPTASGLAEGIIVPTKAAREIARIARRAGGSAVHLDVGRSAVAIATGDERLTSKLIDGIYPDWRRVVPGAAGKSATFDLAEMVAALDRVVKVMAASQSGKATEKNKAGSGIKLAADGDWLTISAAGAHSVAEANDAVKAEFAGEWPTLGVSAKYLHATLANMRERGAETVMLDTADAGSPIRAESITDEDFLAIVMPMRVS